jgi:hypothetical protein
VQWTRSSTAPDSAPTGRSATPPQEAAGCNCALAYHLELLLSKLTFKGQLFKTRSPFDHGVLPLSDVKVTCAPPMLASYIKSVSLPWMLMMPPGCWNTKSVSCSPCHACHVMAETALNSDTRWDGG